MIFKTVAKPAWKQAQIRCNQAGAFIALKWQEWSSGSGSSSGGGDFGGSQPLHDPTTGAQLTGATYIAVPSGGPPQKAICLNPDGNWNYLVTNGGGEVPFTAVCRTRAFTHFVGPTTSRGRIFAEIKEGDCIMDFVIPIVQIANPGDTTFAVGQIVDIFTFGATNRALSLGQTLATKFPTPIQIDSLQNPSVSMYKCKSDWLNDVNAEEWVQASIGKDLARSWESVYAGELLGQAMLLRKAT